MKKKVKVAFANGEDAKGLKNGNGKGKKRRVLGGLTNSCTSSSSSFSNAPLSREDTLILDELAESANRKAIELTVSPLADASEAYLSLPASPMQRQVSLSSSSISGYIEVKSDFRTESFRIIDCIAGIDHFLIFRGCFFTRFLLLPIIAS